MPSFDFHNVSKLIIWEWEILVAYVFGICIYMFTCYYNWQKLKKYFYVYVKQFEYITKYTSDFFSIFCRLYNSRYIVANVLGTCKSMIRSEKVKELIYTTMHSYIRVNRTIITTAFY